MARIAGRFERYTGRLVDFAPADWRGETVADRFGQWTAARRAYYQEHGEPCHALGGPHNQYGGFHRRA